MTETVDWILCHYVRIKVFVSLLFMIWFGLVGCLMMGQAVPRSIGPGLSQSPVTALVLRPTLNFLGSGKAVPFSVSGLGYRGPQQYFFNAHWFWLCHGIGQTNLHCPPVRAAADRAGTVLMSAPMSLLAKMSSSVAPIS